jgi:phage recombination protein Bet
MSNDLMVLPPNVAARGLTVSQWNTLCDSLFPGAKADSVLMVVDYCKARGYDVMKKPCHIVPISVKQGDSYVYRDVVMPGIYQYRIDAHRTKQYLGHSEPEYGPRIDILGVKAPEWCRMTMYRWHEQSQTKIEYPVLVMFSEVCATRWDKDAKAHVANERWKKAPLQMLTKCTEAAGLREAFPDELGGTHTEDEMYGKAIDVEAQVVATVTQTQGEQKAEPKRKAKPLTKEPEAVVDKDRVDDDDTAGEDGFCLTKSQVTLLEKRLTAAGIEVNALCAAFEIGTIAELPFDKMQEATAWIEEQQK